MTTTLDLIGLRQRLGGTVYDGGTRWVGPGPGHSRRDASLSVRLTCDGRPLVHSFAGDPFLDCAEHLGLARGEGRPFDRNAIERERRERAEKSKARENAVLRFCSDVWAGAKPAIGTPAATYLRSRGLVGSLATDLRFHPAAPLSYSGEHTRPAMVAVVRSVDGRPKGLHVTALRPDGLGKATGNARRMFGAVTGAAVQLAPHSGLLAVAEGIETALSFTAIHEIPCWAALSTSGLLTFQPPTGLRRLFVAADADDGGAGMGAARRLAERVQRTCEVVISPAPDGADWNDALRDLTP